MELEGEAEKRWRQRAETEAETKAEERVELNITHIISNLERCRKILAVRFPDLKSHTIVAEEAQNMKVGDPEVTTCDDTCPATSTRY